MIVGLTGGIASGKSLVSAYLIKKGVPVIDADAISRRITEPGGTGAAAILQEFGSGFFFPDGSLNRKALADAVFASPEETKRLESLLHPLILQEISRQIQEAPTPLTVLDAPLLLEAGLKHLCDKVVNIEAPRETRVQRAMARSELTRKEILERMDRQYTNQQRRTLADFTLENTGTPEDLYKKVDTLLLCLSKNT